MLPRHAPLLRQLKLNISHVVVHGIPDSKEETAHVTACAEEQQKLLSEQRQHGDLLLLPRHVDVYRFGSQFISSLRHFTLLTLPPDVSTLPAKVALFHAWAAASGASFSLKTDDDCYLDVDLYVTASSFLTCSIFEQLHVKGLRGKPNVRFLPSKILTSSPTQS